VGRRRERDVSYTFVYIVLENATTSFIRIRMLFTYEGDSPERQNVGQSYTANKYV